MKKLLVALLTFCLLLPSLAHAEEPAVANGTYSNSEATFIQSIIVEDTSITLVLSPVALFNHLDDIIVLQSNAEPRINPNLSAEEIAEKRKEYGLDYDMKAILTELAETVPSDISSADVQKEIETRVPGLYVHLAPTTTSYIHISRATLSNPDSLLGIRLFDREILLLEKLNDTTLKYGDYEYVKE
ncbi:MAG: hypothetical protein Q4A10_04115 [Aerococcaceae bacterium]|nr:hypothetical protein [Aerococcaceae bacterium]